MKKGRWQFYDRVQREVYWKLKARERPEAVVAAGWGLLDHFFIFLFRLGFFARVDFRPKRVKRVMIPTVLMILTYEVKQLMGIARMNQLEEHLFRDTALLKIIGFTARQIQDGFCHRGKGNRGGCPGGQNQRAREEHYPGVRTRGAAKVLLIDRGFIDGVLLWWLWKQMKIRFVMPARSNMEVSQDIRGFRSEKADGQTVFVEQTKKMKGMGVKGLLSYDQLGEEQHRKRKGRKDVKANPINGVMVLRWDGKDYEPGKEKVFLTNLSVSRPMKIMEQYDLRSEIENQGFREFKQGYHLWKYPQKTGAAVRTHAVLTLIIYSLVNAYKSEPGQRLAHLGIRRWRRKQMAQSIHTMIVYYEGIYGFVDVEELFYLMDMSIIPDHGTPKELYRLKIQQLQREVE